MSELKSETSTSPRIAVYSAVYGDYDVPAELPKLQDPNGSNVPAVLYTDRKMTVPGWRVRVKPMDDIPEASTDNLKAKYWKLFPDIAVPRADITIWLDGNFTVDNPERFIYDALNALGDDMLSLPTHPTLGRNCVYKELHACQNIWPSRSVEFQAQEDFYRHIGHPESYGLYATGIMVRRHTDQIAGLAKHWWHEVVTRTHRDQASLPVLLRILSEERGVGEHVTWNTNYRWGQNFHLRSHKENNR